MFLARSIVIATVLVVAISCAATAAVVLNEDFSSTFVERDWIYNNSGNNSARSYEGYPDTWNAWVCKVDDVGTQILGYEPSPPYYPTGFESPTFSVGNINTQDGWVGTGVVTAGGHQGDQSARFIGQSAYRNVTTSMERNVQWMQCYVKCTDKASYQYIYLGTTNMAAVAAQLRLDSSGNIQALNGNQSGGGSWVTVGSYAAMSWYRIRVKLDYTTYKWEVDVDGALRGTNLGFRDSGATSGFNTVKFEQSGSGQYFYVDDLYTGNSPYPPAWKGSSWRPYWSDAWNHWTVDYPQPIADTRDTYDWMSYTNTDSTKPPCFKASLPTGWTAAFQAWADMDPSDNYWSSGRGKMGFGRYTGPYSEATGDPCLHAWASHGNMRIVSANITSGPGVYTMSWKGGVWNGNTADPAQQYKWTDWCSWGYGYTNWSPWDPAPPVSTTAWEITTPPYRAGKILDTNDQWVWRQDPFRQVDPDGVIAGRTDGPHPVGEEPGMWHSFSRDFAFGVKPAKDGTKYKYYSDPGYFIGFKVAHSHDANEFGGDSRWATIMNVDDIVLTKKDPVTIQAAMDMPVGSLVEIDGLVITNQVVLPNKYSEEHVEIYLETQDRGAGIMVRVSGDLSSVWDSYYDTPVFQKGNVVNVIGALSKDARNVTGVDERNPVMYIAAGDAGARLPAIIKTADSPATPIKPLAMTNRSVVGKPVATGLSSSGMLVTVVGRVNNGYALGDPIEFYVDDGSGVDPGKPYNGAPSNAMGVRIDCTALGLDLGWNEEIPVDGTYVAVTGTCTAELQWDGTTIVRVVYPRTSTDIKEFPE